MTSRRHHLHLGHRAARSSPGAPHPDGPHSPALHGRRPRTAQGLSEAHPPPCRRTHLGDDVLRPADRTAGVHLFGVFRVVWTLPDGTDCVLAARDFGGRKPRQLLQHLLLARGRVVPVDVLATALWGGQAPTDPAATLQHYVSVLRRQLRQGPGWLPDVVVRERSGYSVDMRRLQLDVSAFDELADRVCDGSPALLSAPETRKAMDDALALVTGDLLEDEPADAGLTAARARYRARHAQLALTAADASLAARDAPRVVALMRLVLLRDPASEPHCVLLMTALSLLGDRAGALAAYDVCAEHLADRLGVDPLPRTRAVRDAVHAARPGPELLALAQGRPGAGARPVPVPA